MERIELQVGTQRKVGAVGMALLGLPFICCGTAIALNGEMQSMGYLLWAVFAGFGLFMIGVPIWLFRMWPVGVDSDGLTMRGGRRLLFRDLVDVKSVRTFRRGQEIAWRVELKFKNGEARIDSITFDNAYTACSFIERVIQRRIIPSSGIAQGF